MIVTVQRTVVNQVVALQITHLFSLVVFKMITFAAVFLNIMCVCVRACVCTPVQRDAV